MMMMMNGDNQAQINCIAQHCVALRCVSCGFHDGRHVIIREYRGTMLVDD
jgi:hypothetical protein